MIWRARRKKWLPQKCPKCGDAPVMIDHNGPLSITSVLNAYYARFSHRAIPDKTWGGHTWEATCGKCAMMGMIFSRGTTLFDRIKSGPKFDGGSYTVSFKGTKP